METNTIHKKICVKMEGDKKITRTATNQASKVLYSTKLLLLSACHNTEIGRISVWGVMDVVDLCSPGWLWSLRPRICLTGWVSVCVQLVICTSTQHQLKMETDKGRKQVIYMKYLKMVHFFVFSLVIFSFIYLHPILNFPLDQTLNILCSGIVFVEVLPHFLSSPHKTLCPRGPPGHTEEPYNWGGMKGTFTVNFMHWMPLTLSFRSVEMQ